jgi:hypothetical protein
MRVSRPHPIDRKTLDERAIVADVLCGSGYDGEARELTNEALSLMGDMNEDWLAPHLQDLRGRLPV